MRFRQLRFLVAVYEEGTITAAAERLHATQSGISAQLKLLEAELGAKLFDRSVSGVVPTMAGTVAYERATRILREASSLIAEMDELQNGLTGTVSAGLMPTTTRSVIAPVLEKFANNYPQVEIRIEEAYSADLTKGVSDGRLDFALVPPTSDMAGLKSTHLEQDVEVFVTRFHEKDSEFPAHLSPIDLTQVQPLKLVLPGSNNARRIRIDECISTYNIPVQKIMELDAMMATLDLVSRSDWTSILPGCLMIDDITSNERSLHPISKPGLTLDYVLVEQTSKHLSPVAQLLCDELQKELSSVCARSRKQFIAPESLATKSIGPG